MSSGYWIGIASRNRLGENRSEASHAPLSRRLDASDSSSADPSSPTGLRDDDCAKDSIESQWAKQFTARYDEVAKELPEFARLTELAKAIAIAKWLKRQGISIDLNWAINQVRTQAIRGTSQVTALSVNWKSEQRTPFNDSRGQGIQTLTQTLNLFGGVDLTVNPEYVPDRGSAQRLRQAVLRGLNENRGKPVFELQVEGRTFYAKVLPITPSGQAMWRDPKVSAIRAVK